MPFPPLSSPLLGRALKHALGIATPRKAKESSSARDEVVRGLAQAMGGAALVGDVRGGVKSGAGRACDSGGVTKSGVGSGVADKAVGEGRGAAGHAEREGGTVGAAATATAGRRRRGWVARAAQSVALAAAGALLAQAAGVRCVAVRVVGDPVICACRCHPCRCQSLTGAIFHNYNHSHTAD